MGEEEKGWSGVFGRRSPEREVDDELRFHMEEEVERLVARGVSEPEARRRVAREFRELDRIRAECSGITDERRRREGREEMIGSIWRDAVLAVRRLGRAPGFAAAAILTLALGIGATVAMYAVVERVVLEPLPYPDPDRLVRIWPGMSFNIALADRFRELPAVESLTGAAGWGFTLTGEGEPERLHGSAVDPEFFSVLGVRPLLGRGFRPEERYHDDADVVVLSHGLWERRFGSDPGVLGRRIDVDGRSVEGRRVVGIMPAGFRPLVEGAELWVPLSTSPGKTVASDSSWYVSRAVARLAPGASLDQVHAQARELAGRLQAEFPGRLAEEQVRAAGAIRLLDATVGEVRRGLWILLGAVGLVLLMACVNVANLLLAEGSRRGRDVAVQAALGASRGRLARQRLVESGVLALGGGVVGVLLAWWALAALGPSLQLALPRTGNLAMSASVAWFALAVSAGSVFVFGLVPALQLNPARIGDALSRGGRTRTGGGDGLSRWLVSVEIALAVVLVVGAGLLLRSFWSLHRTDPGFDPRGVLAVEVAPPGGEDPARRSDLRDFYRRALEAVREVPGVVGAGAIHLLPLSQGNWRYPYLAEGMTPSGDEPLPDANFRIVSPDYFRTLGIPLVEGRPLDPGEAEEGVPQMLVNETFAEGVWPGEDPVGRELLLFGNVPFRVAGVVGDVRQHALDRTPEPEMYVSYRRWTGGSLYFMIRGRNDPAGLAGPVREAIWALDPDVPIPTVARLTDVVGDSVARARFHAFLLAGFGALALLLGAVGVYGVMAHHVAGRLREFGVRLALGADPGQVVREAVARGLVPVAVGLGAGLGAALLASGLLDRLLYQISATDPVTYLGVAVFLGAVALAAAWIPARRASRVDPVAVLTAE